MAPQPRPSPRCRPCRIPCADVLRAGGTAALRKEIQAAQTEAWVTPGGQTATYRGSQLNLDLNKLKHPDVIN